MIGLQRPIPLDLVAERAIYQNDLFRDFLPFMERHVIDHEFGGFLCNVKPNGELVSTQKRTWYEGRGIWAYSFLFNHIAADPKYLEVAGRSVRLLRKTEPENPLEFRPMYLNRDGSAIGPPDTEVYSDMFVAEGLAEYSKATGDLEYWEEARRIVLKCLSRYDAPDYHPSVGETYLGPNARRFPGARVGGVWMVFIRTLTQMLTMRHDDRLADLCGRSVNALLHHHFNPRFRLLNELLNHDLSRPENEYEQLVYAGHAIETLWMLMDEALRLGNVVLFDHVAKLFHRHCEVAKDPVFGGLFRNLVNVDQNAWTLDKTLFPHQEALIGCMRLIEQTGDPWAVAFYKELAEFTRSRFPMRAIHSPLWQVTGDRFVTLTPGMTRAENYHHPRFIMLNLLALDRIIQRKGLPARVA